VVQPKDAYEINVLLNHDLNLPVEFSYPNTRLTFELIEGQMYVGPRRMEPRHITYSKREGHHFQDPLSTGYEYKIAGRDHIIEWLDLGSDHKVVFDVENIYPVTPWPITPPMSSR
jgi:hypothetical protein